jgi:hypothetical protein
LKVVPFSLRQPNLPEHRHEVEVHPRVVDPKRHHDGAPGPLVHANKPHSINFLNKEMADRGCCGGPRRSFRFRGSVWSFQRLNDSGNARADPSISSRDVNMERNKPLPKIHPRGQLEFATKLLSRVLTSSKFLISGCLLVFLRSLKLFGNISVRSARVARGALLIGPAGSILNQRSSRNVQRHRFLGVFGRN